MANILDLIKAGNEAIQFLKEAYEQGKGITEALRTLREGGLGIADSTARGVYSYLSGPLNTGREYVSNLSLEAIPTVPKLAPSLTPTLRNFTYIVKFTNQPADLSQAETRYITVSTNTLLSKSEALDTAVAYGGRYPSTFEPSADIGQVEDILQNSAGLL